MVEFGANKVKTLNRVRSVRAEQTKLTSKLWGLGCAIATMGIVAMGASDPASALPSFARQTGQPCGACHTDFPGLTPFGREFKLGGYTLGGGDYALTPFEGIGDGATKALDSYAKKLKGKDGKDAKTGDTAGAPDGSYHGWVPPIAMMSIFQFTHTATDLDPASVFTPFGVNDNTKLGQASIFWGGAITEHVGAFAQYTYEPFHGQSDVQNPYDGKEWHWDNVDIRAANSGTIGKVNVTYGLTATNNPSMADPWNTTPAWGFPYTDAGDFGKSPAADVMLDGTWAQHVMGAGGYGWFNNLVYAQLSGFWSLDPSTQGFFGIDPQDGVPGKIDSVAPYWRVAIEPHWGNNWWEFGVFGMTASFKPYDLTQVNSANEYTFGTLPQSNRYTDVGFDSQYQYQGDNYWITGRATYIHESQSFDLLTGASSNTSNTLNSLKLYGSVAYGNDNRFILSGQWFDTWGSADAMLYSANANNSPNSNGFTLELAYMPYVLSHPKIWPWANARVGVQYTIYNEFDGTSTGASDNNTFNIYLWVAG